MMLLSGQNEDTGFEWEYVPGDGEDQVVVPADPYEEFQDVVDDLDSSMGGFDL